VKHISTSGATISVRVSCTGSTSCKIKLTGTVRETIRGGKVIALAASTKTTKKTITIASKTVTIPAGATKTIKLTLNRAGKKLLAKHHPLKAKLIVTQSRKTVTSKTISLKPSTKKKKR
jgi:NAD dependent epimerase/dehydratase family enzyme